MFSWTLRMIRNRLKNRVPRHSSEGPDDMPAHIRAALTQTHLTIPVDDGLLALGQWQGVFLFEHRNHAHSREVRIHLMGE